MATQTNAQKALRIAREKAKTCRSWIELHNHLFGVGGQLVTLFATQAERVAFGRSPESKAIDQLIDECRQKHGDPAPLADRITGANGSISVRMPKSLHAALIVEAEKEGVSLNQLAVTKLTVGLAANLL